MTESTDSCNFFYDEFKSDESVVDITRFYIMRLDTKNYMQITKLRAIMRA